jgi:hypothetical protein
MTRGRILAHGLGGAGGVLAHPRLEGEAARDGRPLPDRVQRFADARATRVGLRVLGLLMAVVTVAVAAIGPNNSAANPADLAVRLVLGRAGPGVAAPGADLAAAQPAADHLGRAQPAGRRP